jgi:hypothetical protein
MELQYWFHPLLQGPAERPGLLLPLSWVFAYVNVHVSLPSGPEANAINATQSAIHLETQMPSAGDAAPSRLSPQKACWNVSIALGQRFESIMECIVCGEMENYLDKHFDLCSGGMLGAASIRPLAYINLYGRGLSPRSLPFFHFNPPATQVGSVAVFIKK